jgi:hypothetical protein
MINRMCNSTKDVVTGVNDTFCTFAPFLLNWKENEKDARQQWRKEQKPGRRSCFIGSVAVCSWHDCPTSEH